MASYLKQFSQHLQRVKTDNTKSLGNKWREIRKNEKLRVFEDRSSGSIPSILMLGSVTGTLDDVMYGAVATTDTEQRIKDRILRDGVEQSKVLHCLVQPTEDDPTRHVSIKWQLYNTRDYVCLDTTGFARSSSGELVGYSLSHSIGFEQLPSFEHHSIDRGKRSVCVFYRQSTPTTVGCYARGFFDFETEMKSDPVFHSVALQVIANQWLSLTRISELAHTKKLTWRMKENCAMLAKTQSSLSTRSTCVICNKSMGRLTSTKRCGICSSLICSRCCVKKLVCTLDESDSVSETSIPFCKRCIHEVSRCNTMELARKEIRTATPNNGYMLPISADEVENQ
ncbi:hypothetical protein P3T76_005266 [Phytophthora citrophthora]|uniref:FYVE-type domain-containing protein n=1 Tax=Phytophthora citrophthora TaxID=4793 RepID=A0AAD9GSB8_9STRA|nr:hypothetical protein P3T76_005266 [Phytophthora citrophthora]